MEGTDKEQIQKEIDRVDQEKDQLQQEITQLQEEKLAMLKKGPKPVSKWIQRITGGSIFLFVGSILCSAIISLIDQLSHPVIASLPVHPLAILGTTFGILTCSACTSIGMALKSEKQHKQDILENHTQINDCKKQIMDKELERNNLITRQNQTTCENNRIEPVKNYPSDQPSKSREFVKQKNTNHPHKTES